MSGSPPDRREAQRTPEEAEYPFAYFDAQVQFAYKWAEISGEGIGDVLLNRTALYRRIIGKKPNKQQLDPLWNQVVETARKTKVPTAFSRYLYDLYLDPSQGASSQYEAPVYPENDGKHFGFFGYDYYPNNAQNEGKNTIKVHFLNSVRGVESGLSARFAPQRRADLQRMFAHIQKTHPEAEEVIGGSWLYNIPGYKESFPPEYIAAARSLVPQGFGHIPNSVENMSFEGNSLWGQFVDRFGAAREKTYNAFVHSVRVAKTKEDLLSAFPELPLQPKAKTEVFFRFLGL